MLKEKMNKKIILKTLLIFGTLLGISGGLFLPDFASAENCPSRTTVEGTIVTFVGELTDMGGDEATSVWFEYGRTTAYGQETSKKNLNQPGFYCITISGLLPSTTYNYRAAAKNEAGTAYGANMSFTTTDEVTVNIKANGSDGPITIPYDSSATLTWISGNADSCVASGAWSGSRATSGSRSTGNITSSRTYTITCEGPRGSASDSVRVNVEGKMHEPTVNIKADGSDGPITIPYDSSATITWSSSNADSCVASGAWSGSRATSGSRSTGNITSSRTYTITCEGPGGSASDSVRVNVETSPTLSVSLSANPNAGCVPLDNVSLTAQVSGTASGNTTYYFDCTDSGVWDGIYTSGRTSYTASRICSYTSVGSYTAKVKAEREDEIATATRTIRVYSCEEDEPTVNIKADGSDGPITIPYDSSATITWSSSNADSCVASGAWSGSRATSGSRSTGNITSSRTYTITCEGPGGSASDSVRVNVEGEDPGDFILRKTVRNLSRGTRYDDLVHAYPGEQLIFGIVIIAGESTLYDVVIEDSLPTGLLYRGDLRIDNVLTPGDVFDGLEIGRIPAGERRVITFRADVAGAASFAFGQTSLSNTAVVSGRDFSSSDTAEVVVTRAAVAGAPTEVPTGWTNNLFLDSFFLPLSLSLFVLYLLKSRIIRLEEWLDKRKRQYQEYKSQKTLKLKVAKTKFREGIRF